MEPRIQYAKTSDGVNIAYAVFGEGTPLLYTPSAYGLGVHFYTHMSTTRGAIDRMVASGLQVVRYDGRGVGSSDRTRTEFTMDAAILDLEAVVDRLGWERFALLGHFGGVQAAIPYASRRPERVSHLIVRDPWASPTEKYQMFPGNHVLDAMRPFAKQHWDLLCVLVAAVGFGLGDGDLSNQYAAALRSGMTPEVLVKLDEATDEIDVTTLLETVNVPTMVILDTSLPGRPHNEVAEWGAPVKRVAASIPDARLVVGGRWETAVSEFVLGSSQSPTDATSARAPGGLQTILFTDIEGSTALTERLGDANARQVLRGHEGAVRGALREHGGSEIKTMGDGFMASFGSATRALECAVAIQKAFAGDMRQETGDIGESLRVRIGINAGEPVAEEGPDGRGDLFGTAVNLAARIAGQAQGGEIFVSDVVRQLAAGKGFLFGDRGVAPLKGFDEPVRLYEVRWREDA